MTDKKRQAPLTWRPYPPIKAILERMPHGMRNWLINVAIGHYGGISEAELDQFRKHYDNEEEG